MLPVNVFVPSVRGRWNLLTTLLQFLNPFFESCDFTLQCFQPLFLRSWVSHLKRQFKKKSPTVILDTENIATCCFPHKVLRISPTPSPTSKKQHTHTHTHTEREREREREREQTHQNTPARTGYLPAVAAARHSTSSDENCEKSKDNN